MKKMIKVYDVKIMKGVDAGCYRAFGLDKVTAEKMAAEFAARYATNDTVIERDTEIVEFADEVDLMTWLSGGDYEDCH